MIILGLGSNCGDRLAYLRRAVYYLKQHVTIIAISPIYESDALLMPNSPPEWNLPYLNCAVSIKTELTPEALLPLLKITESKVGLRDKRRWSPRKIDIDILAWDDLIINSERLTIPHVGLLERPFALLPLADIAPHWRYPLADQHQDKSAELLAQEYYQAKRNILDTKKTAYDINLPQLVGILNLTPDSFSGDGLLNNAEQAFQTALQHARQGATILDIGAESTRPGAQLLDANTEWQRLEPLLNKIKYDWPNDIIKPRLSIDSRYTSTMRQACEYDLAWINDVSCFSDDNMLAFAIDNQLDIVIMHHLTIPADKTKFIPEHCDCIIEVYDWLARKIDYLTQSGIDRDRIISDVGIGFGKTATQELNLIKNIIQFHNLGTKLLVGHSRKSFLSLVTDKPFAERDLETSIVSSCLANQGVDYLRVHNVESNNRALRLSNLLN